MTDRATESTVPTEPGFHWELDIEPSTCPVCGRTGDAARIGRRVTSSAELVLLRCLDCDSIEIRGGAGDAEPSDAQLEAYVEGAAGIDSIIANLYRVHDVPVDSLLDVGCHVGFAVHYAQQVLGWRSVGIEPSRAGAWGAARLGTDIRPVLLDASTQLEGTFDLVIASEVLEHVPEPASFLAAMRDRLSDRGTLVLTTPDAALISVDDENLARQLIGVGEHRFLASARGLDALLRSVGFASVAVARHGVSLVAVAALDPARAVSVDATGPSPAQLIEYFAAMAESTSDPELANAAWSRMFGYAVAVGDWEQATLAETRVVESHAQLLGLRLDQPATLLDAVRAAPRIPRTIIPFAHAAAMSRLVRGVELAAAVEYFRLCIAVADEVYARERMLDAWSVELRHDSYRHLALAVTRTDPARAIEHLDRAIADDPARGDEWTLRVFIDLVALGADQQVTALAPRVVASFSRFSQRADADLGTLVDACVTMSVLAIRRDEAWNARTWTSLGFDLLDCAEFSPADTARRRAGLDDSAARARELHLPSRPGGDLCAYRPGHDAALWTGVTGQTDHPGSVSVVIAMYNGRDYIEAALRSIVEQTVQPLEVIVVDDGSTDGSGEFVNALNLDLPIRVVRRSNGGQSAARNTGIRIARGEYVALLDQDDSWRRGHLAGLVPVLDKDPECAWAFTDFDGVDADGRTITRHFLAETHTVHPRNSVAGIVGADVMALPSASLLRRSAVVAARGFDRRLIGYEDDDVFVRLFLEGWTYRFVERSTVRYRLHDAGASASTSTAFLRSRLIFLDKMLELLPDDHRRGLFYSGDYLYPRFITSTMREYSQAIALRDYARAHEIALALQLLIRMRGHATTRTRLGLRLMLHPRRFRQALLLVESLPPALRPRLQSELQVAQTTVVRAERAHLMQGPSGIR